jgi:hypothetical protein
MFVYYQEGIAAARRQCLFLKGLLPPTSRHAGAPEIANPTTPS